MGNTQFNIMVLVHYLTILDVMHGYSLNCPQAVNWNVRSKDLCILKLTYVCIYDDVKGNATESCNGPLPTIAKGYTWVFRGNPDRGKCSSDTYQPFKHKNSKSSDCVYQKSLCSEEGQVVFDTGYTIVDQTCRCDYRRGYDFVVQPRNRCYCYPLEEDCSCYIRPCNNTETLLSKDYHCKDMNTTVCPSIEAVLDGNRFQLERVFRHTDIEINWIKIYITLLLVCPIVVLSAVYVSLVQIHQHYHRAVFVDLLKNIDCIEGDEIILQCKVAGKNEKASWSTNSKIELSNDAIGKDNNIHQVVIRNVKQEHSGSYTVTIRGKRSTAVLTVTGIFTSGLETQTSFFGEDVTFKCTLAVLGASSIWFKDEIVDYLSTQWHSNCNYHALTITAVSFEDEGQYSIKVRQVESQAKLIVKDSLSIKTEDVHYLLSVFVILKIATPAVRSVFDEEFDPKTLADTLHKNVDKLRQLKVKKHFNLAEWRLLYKEPFTSKKLDLRLMVLLLRNIAGLKIANKLPLDNDRSKTADLCRIHYYRNMIAHYQGRMSAEDFKPFWKVLKEVVQRLTGKDFRSYLIIELPEQPCNVTDSDGFALAVKALLDSEPDDIQEIIRNISTEERNFLRIVHLLHRVACPAVRYKFNQLFVPANLKQILKEKRSVIEELLKNERITTLHWKLLFQDIDRTSSKTYGLKLMAILLCELGEPRVIQQEEIQVLNSLELYLQIVARSSSGQLSMDTFEEYWNKICEAIIVLGGPVCGHRFKSICCSLCIKGTRSMDYLQTL